MLCYLKLKLHTEQFAENVDVLSSQGVKLWASWGRTSRGPTALRRVDMPSQGVVC